MLSKQVHRGFIGAFERVGEFLCDNAALRSIVLGQFNPDDPVASRRAMARDAMAYICQSLSLEPGDLAD